MMWIAYLVSVLLLLADAAICLPVPEADKPKDGGVIINVHGGPIHHVRDTAEAINAKGGADAFVDAYYGTGSYGINKARRAALRSREPRGEGGSRILKLLRRILDPTDVYYVDAFTWPTGPSAKAKRDSLAIRDVLKVRDAGPDGAADGWVQDWPMRSFKRLIRDAADGLATGKRVHGPPRRSETVHERGAAVEGKRDATPVNAGWCSDWPTRGRKTRDAALEGRSAPCVKPRGDLGPDNVQRADPAGWSRDVEARGDLGPENFQSKHSSKE